MRTPPPDIAARDYRDLANMLTARTWERALDLASAAHSTITGGSGGPISVGGHSDPTSAAAFTRTPVPTVRQLRSAFDVLAERLGASADRSVGWCSGKLRGEAQLLTSNQHATEYALVHAAVVDLHRLMIDTITPAALADYRQAKAVRRCFTCQCELDPTDHHVQCSADRTAWYRARQEVWYDDPDPDTGRPRGRARWTNHRFEHVSDLAHWSAWMQLRIADPDHPDNITRTGLNMRPIRPGSPYEPAAVA